jgi:hypothetical protein
MKAVHLVRVCFRFFSAAGCMPWQQLAAANARSTLKQHSGFQSFAGI